MHAGAGTSTCALRAGTPQLTLPMLFDQPAWAERLQQMGVGRRLDPKELECRVPLHASAHHDALDPKELEALHASAHHDALDPKELEARGAVDYLVRQLRYVSMDEGVRARL